MEIITTRKENLQLDQNFFEKKIRSSSFKQALNQAIIELSMKKKEEAKNELEQSQIQINENVHLLRKSFLKERQAIFKEKMDLKDKLSSNEITRDEYYNLLSLFSSKSQQALKAYRNQVKEVRRSAKEEVRQYIEEVKEAQGLQRTKANGLALSKDTLVYIDSVPFKLLEGEARVTQGSLKVALSGKMQIGNVEFETIPEDKDVEFVIQDVFRLEKNRIILKQIEEVTLRDGVELKVSSSHNEFKERSYSTKEKLQIINLGEPIVIKSVAYRSFAIKGNIARPNDPIVPPPDDPIIPPRKKWTFMVYLDGDNNLEEYAINDLNEMEIVGSSNEVNIITQFDRIPGYNSSNGDWTGTRRYYVKKDSDPVTINSQLVQDIDEVNMGAPATLSDFVNWAIQNYPAENYALILWNHGNGYRGLCLDESSGNDDLSLKELKESLAQVGTRIELVGFDACLMQMTEVAYQIKDQAKVMVGPEEAVEDTGWPYDTILNDLVANPGLTPADLGRVIVNRYGEFYDYLDSIATLSAVDLSQMGNLASSISTLANSMGDPYWNEIKSSRNDTEEYINNTYVDLYHFADLISQNVPDATIQSNANDVKARINSAIIAEWHGPGNPNSHGLAIYFPKDSVRSDYDGSIIHFPADTTWDEFLRRFVTM